MVREQSEISMDYINLPDPSAGGFASKSRTGEDSAETPAVSGETEFLQFNGYFQS